MTLVCHFTENYLYITLMEAQNANVMVHRLKPYPLLNLHVLLKINVSGYQILSEIKLLPVSIFAAGLTFSKEIAFINVTMCLKKKKFKHLHKILLILERETDAKRRIKMS